MLSALVSDTERPHGQPCRNHPFGLDDLLEQGDADQRRPRVRGEAHLNPARRRADQSRAAGIANREPFEPLTVQMNVELLRSGSDAPDSPRPGLVSLQPDAGRSRRRVE